MKRLLTVLSILAVFAVVTLAMAAAPDVVNYDTKFGKVTFKHKDHQKRVGEGRCNTCHHKNKADGSDAAKCASCHTKKEVMKEGKKVVKIKDAFHKKCKACHKAEKKGPTKCKECHVK